MKQLIKPETVWQPTVSAGNPFSDMPVTAQEFDKIHPQVSTKSIQAPLRPLTRKQSAFVQHLIKNPKDSATEAVAQTYNIRSGRHTAEVIAHENLRKPEIMAELAKYSGSAEMAVIQAMSAEKKNYLFNPETKSYELMDTVADHAIRLRAADSLLDRVHGKATQHVETQSKVVTLNVDLTGMLTDTDTV
jgi:hypothetical protein